MKLTHVFGLVIAIHVAAITLIFVTPGCRSSGKTKSRADQTASGVAATTSADAVAPLGAPAMGYADINAAAVTPSPEVGDAGMPAVVAPVVRVAPTRPSAASAAAPVAAASATPVAGSAEHTVAKGDSLWVIARKYGISVAELAAANQISPNAPLRIGQTLKVPARPAAPASSTPAEATNLYEVKTGDTLGAIARRLGTTPAALRTANNLNSDNIRVGQKLVIPGNAPPPESVASVAPAAITTLAPAPAPAAGPATHTVAPGETLGGIARRYGVRSGDLATLNTITDPAKLRAGQVLRLPAGARVDGATAQSSAAAQPAPSAPARPAPGAVQPGFTPPPPTVSPAPAPIAPVVPVSPVAPVVPIQPVAPVDPVEPFVAPVLSVNN